MWYILFLVFLGLAIGLIWFAVKKESNPFWNIICSLISAVLWLVLALTGMRLEFPYQYYNATSSAVELGYNTYTSPISPYESYIFILFFWITFIYLIAMIWDKWATYKNPYGRE